MTHTDPPVLVAVVACVALAVAAFVTGAVPLSALAVAAALVVWRWAGVGAESEALAFGPPGVRVPVPSWARAMVVQRDGMSCVYCARATHRNFECPSGGDCPACMELDHRDPVALGGANTVANLAVACQACNRAKGCTPLPAA